MIKKTKKKVMFVIYITQPWPLAFHSTHEVLSQAVKIYCLDGCSHWLGPYFNFDVQLLVQTKQFNWTEATPWVSTGTLNFMYHSASQVFSSLIHTKSHQRCVKAQQGCMITPSCVIRCVRVGVRSLRDMIGSHSLMWTAAKLNFSE